MNRAHSTDPSRAVARRVETESYTVVVSALNGDCICQVEVDAEYTVLRLKQEIERTANVQVVVQQLSFSGGLLHDEDRLPHSISSADPFHVSLTASPPWTEEEIDKLNEDLMNVIQEGNREELVAVLAKMPLYVEDKANVLGVQHPESSVLMTAIHTHRFHHYEFSGPIVDVVNSLPPEVQEEFVLPAVTEDGDLIGYFEQMQGNYDICLAAVEQDGRAIEYISAELKSNLNICLAAVRRWEVQYNTNKYYRSASYSQSHVLKLCPEEMQQHEDVRAAAGDITDDDSDLY